MFANNNILVIEPSQTGRDMKKILVVDDEESVRIILKQMLEQGGYSAEVASDGAEALDKLKADNYHMIITDINMPGMDGVELLKKSKELFPKLPVIFVTGFGKDKIILQAMKLGLSNYIEKPFKMDDVLKIVKDYISN